MWMNILVVNKCTLHCNVDEYHGNFLSVLMSCLCIRVLIVLLTDVSPTEDKVFFDSRKKKQKRHLEAAMFDVQAAPKVYHRQPALDRSAHALLLLQQTLSLRPVSPAVPCGTGQEFIPSRRLQDLYERYMLESDSSSSDDTSTVDYEALVFGDGELYHNLQKVWSMCYSTDNDDVDNYGINDVFDDGESDIDLDIDYDALLGDNADYVTAGDFDSQCGVSGRINMICMSTITQHNGQLEATSPKQIFIMPTPQITTTTSL
jgi:hypothetical protein